MAEQSSSLDRAKRKGGKHWPEWELSSMIEVMERQGLLNFAASLRDVRLELSKYRRACHLSLKARRQCARP